jgi:transposase InsO family protein
MAQKVVAMETKLRAILAAGLSGVRVSDLCEELEISRQTFYKYKRRWEAEGPAGLVERSRRPHRSPRMIPAELEDEIVRLRKELPLDNGAQTIAYHLGRSGWDVPSVATIYRALVRRGLVVHEPRKRPRASWRRFEWPRPNDAWQIDATCWVLRSGREVWVMDVLDDHSRLVVAARVCDGPTSEAAWSAFCDATQRYGIPAHVMSDNGSCFTGRFFSKHEAAFERDLRALGVRHIRSTPGHPQTCGKIERFHQTLKRWLRTQPLARSRRQLQDQLDDFLAFYNQQRPHRALSGATPAERWAASEPASPGQAIPEPPHASLHKVATNNLINWGRHRINVGPGHVGEYILVIARDDDLTVFDANGLIQRLRLDRTRNYQLTGRPPGRRPKPKTPVSAINR